MTKKLVLPLASALAALTTNGVATDPAIAAVSPEAKSVNTNDAKEAGLAGSNTFVAAGETLMGFLVTEQADGTTIAQHQSHASHASHASHYSSR